MPNHTWKELIYKLFLTRDDDLDTLQLLFAAIIIVSLLVSWRVVVSSPDISEAVKIEAIITLRWLAGLLVITAIPKWMVPDMVKMLIRAKLPERPSQSSIGDSIESTEPISEDTPQ